MGYGGNPDYSRGLEGNTDAARRFNLTKGELHDVPADVAEQVAEGVDRESLEKMSALPPVDIEPRGLVARLRRLLRR